MGKSTLVQRTLELARVPMLRLNYHEVIDMQDVIVRTVVELERFLRDRSPVARKLVPWMRECGLELREIRSAISGNTISASIGVPSDHLKRVFGYIRDAQDRAPFALFVDELQDVRDRLPDRAGIAALAILRDEIQHMSSGPVFFAGSARASFTLLFTADASPFYEHAPLAAVEPIPEREMLRFIEEQFERGHGIEADATALILRIAGDSPNDIQRLCHETWNENASSPRTTDTATVQRAFERVLRDMTPYCQKWMEDLSAYQQRVVFTAAFLENVGASTNQFLELAGIRNAGSVDKALAKASKGEEALLEKIQSHYRFRSRFVRLWFALRADRVRALIPAMRTDEAYRQYLKPVLPALPVEPGPTGG